MNTPGARVRLRHFTDPGCPFAFSAERQRMRLLWVYGEQIEWELHMVVLSTHADYDADTRALSRGMHGLAARYEMPIDWRARRYAAATIHACRAVVAVGLRWPERQEAFLRALRVLTMAGELLDDSDTLEIAAERAGLPVRSLAEYADAPEVHEALAADMAAARSPSPAALAQDDRLAGPPEERRYTCPSYELERLGPPADGLPDIPRLDLPGFRPIEAYVAALANLAPELSRRNDPVDPLAVLEWAPYPLATAEIAAVCDAEVDETRAALGRTGAHFTPVGWDGYWSPPPT